MINLALSESLHPTIRYKWLVVVTSFVIAFTNFSYMPLFVSKIGHSYVYFIWAFLFFLLFVSFVCSSCKFTKPTLIVTFLFVLFFLSAAVQYIFVTDTAFKTRLFSSMLTIFFIYINGVLAGQLIDIKQSSIFKKVFSYSCVAMAVVLFFKYLLGSDITSTSYLYQDGKNEISILFLSAIIFLLLDNKKVSLELFIFNLCCVGILILDIFYLRCRSALVVLIVPLSIVIFSKSGIGAQYKPVVLAGITALIMLVCFIPSFRETIFLSLLSFGKEYFTFSSFATGRFEEIIKGMDAWTASPLFGVGKFKVECFWISFFVQYGIVFGGTLILLIATVSFYLYKNRLHPLAFTIFVLLLSYLFLGVFEELMPVGPGVRVYILWFLTGFLLSKTVGETQQIYEGLPQLSKSFSVDC